MTIGAVEKVIVMRTPQSVTNGALKMAIVT